MAAPNLSTDDRELRCRSTLIGVIKNGLLEVKCKHWYCTRNNAVTFHYFDLSTGQLVDTKQYTDPLKGDNK